jgi:hypothetical protein
VSSIDLDSLGLNGLETQGVLDGIDDDTIILRGDIVRDDADNYGHLTVSEAWQSGSWTPSGIVYELSDLGIECFAAPCNNIGEAKLNSTLSKTLNAVVADNEKLQDAALNGLYQDGTILAAGSNKSGGVLKITDFYLPVVHKIDPALACTTDADCTVTAYTHDVETADDCYCARCGNVILNTTTAAGYESDFHAVCDALPPRICPMYMCMLPPTAYCNTDDGECEAVTR